MAYINYIDTDDTKEHQMAYMDQERKAKIAAEVAKVVPKGWKYTLSVRHHSTIVMTISEAPFDILGAVAWGESGPRTYFDVNKYHVRAQFADECVADVLEAILAALNAGNHDRSDIQSDYFDVGWYVDLNIGRWDKAFRFAPARAKA